MPDNILLPAPLKTYAPSPSQAWIGVATLLLLGTLSQSFLTLEPGHVAIRVNNMTGGIETITQPGLVMTLPFDIHSAQVVDASPQTFHMRGDVNRDALLVRELTVRASDGSNFAFNDTTIIFKILPTAAERIVTDAGPGHAFHMWMLPYARAIMRDEFGRESTISVSNPTTFGQATERARVRFNELLAKHGLEVTSIVTPRPRFSDAYEELIEARNQAENELSVIDSNLERAGTDRTRRLAEVDRDQNKLMQQMRAALEKELATSVATQMQTHREADSYRIETIARGEAARSGASQKAAQLQGQLEADYSTRKAQVDAFREQPVERVMERLAQRLVGVTISIQPWSDDSVPSRLQMEQVGGVK